MEKKVIDYEKVLEEMTNYLKHENHYLGGEEIKTVKLIKSFEFALEEKKNGLTAYFIVFQVTTNKNKYFAVDGNIEKNKCQNFYAMPLPDALTAAKVHLYFMLTFNTKNEEKLKWAEEVANYYDLPPEYRNKIY